MDTSRSSTDYRPVPLDEAAETLDIRSLEALKYLERKCEPGILYNQTELLEMLKEMKFTVWLKSHGYPGLSMVDRRWTSLQVVLHNLWRNGLVKKLATGIFAASGRPTGVVWRIVNERQNLRLVRRLQDEI